MENVNAFVKTLKTGHIVSLYNAANPAKPVTKFSDRTTAEKRLAAILAKGELDVSKYTDLLGLPATAVITDKASDKAIKALEAEPKPKPKAEAEPPLRRQKLMADIKAVLAVKPVVVDSTPQAKAPISKPAITKPTPVPAAPKAQNTPPHLNLRCPVCAYYAKSTPAMLKLARLVCPVDRKHGILMTAEERGEKRGR